MSTFGDKWTATTGPRAQLFALFGGVTVSYAQGANSKTSTGDEAWRRSQGRNEEVDEADSAEDTYRFKADFFAAGFTGGPLAAITPSPGDFITEAGVQWTVGEGIRLGAQGAIWTVPVKRRIQRGVA